VSYISRAIVSTAVNYGFAALVAYVIEEILGNRAEYKSDSL